jgi:CRAL/TRIO domain
MQRYEETLAWRRAERMDTILREPSPHFDVIKKYYPHYYHLRGRNNQPVFYERPAQADLEALRDRHGVSADQLLRHYMMITEFEWQYLERDDLARSIYVIDLDGIRLHQFAGDAVSFVRTVSQLSARHYPERAGYVYILNVPRWFKLIWRAISPMVDESTLQKIVIVRGSQEEIYASLLRHIPAENIPPEYGGTSVPLGQAPEEETLFNLVRHNNAVWAAASANPSTAAAMVGVCAQPCDPATHQHWSCPFCTWVPARSY